MQPIKIENFLNFKALLWYFRKVYTQIGGKMEGSLKEKELKEIG